MEATYCVLVVIVATLTVGYSNGAAETLFSNITSNQLTNIPDFGSTVVLKCFVRNVPFYKVTNKVNWLKAQQNADGFIYVSDKSISQRYTVNEVQYDGQLFSKALTITGYSAADAGTYRCNATGDSEVLITDIILEAALENAQVGLFTTAPEANGMNVYDSGDMTTCTFNVNGTLPGNIKITYNGQDHTADFTLDRKSETVGNQAGLRTVHQIITATSYSFRPLTASGKELRCSGLSQDNRELGSSLLTVGLKVLPQLTCVQTGSPVAMRGDLDVSIVCTVKDYDWRSSSKITWSFVALADGVPKVFSVSGGASKIIYDREVLDKGTQHVMKFVRVNYDVSTYPEHNITLTEDDVVLTHTTYALKVLNKDRISSADAASASILTALVALCVVTLQSVW